MVEKDIKVSLNELDDICKMFLSVYSGFRLRVCKNDDEEYTLSLDILSQENNAVAYDDYYEYDIGKIISLNNVSVITEDVIKSLKDVISKKGSSFPNKEVIKATISDNIDKIKEELKGLLLEIAQGCNFCLGYNSLETDEDNSSGIDVWMENSKLHAQEYYEGIYSINYCPMCGRKLKED